MKRPQGRQAQKQATRARILEVARTHFEREGFANANVRAIASEAEVAVGTVLLHFSDKLGLLHGALYEDLEVVIDQAIRKTSRGLLLNRICGIVVSFFDYYALRPRLSKILLRESWFAESPWKERFSEQGLRVGAHIANLVEEAKQSGEILQTSDTQLFVGAFLSYYYLALLAWVQGGMGSPMPWFKKLMEEHISRLANSGGATGSTPSEALTKVTRRTPKRKRPTS